MDLRLLAEKDLSMTLEADGQEFILTDSNGVDYVVKGKINDIGFATDSMGQQIATRTINANWRLKKLVDADGAYILPENGWIVTWTNLQGVEQKGYVTRCEPDSHLGLGRAYISLDLS